MAIAASTRYSDFVCDFPALRCVPTLSWLKGRKNAKCIARLEWQPMLQNPVLNSMDKKQLISVMDQFDRLKHRHSEAMMAYERRSLMDLSNALRNWVEMKEFLMKEFPRFSSTVAFSNGSPKLCIRRAVRGKKHAFAYMPGGVITFAANGAIASFPEVNHKNSEVHMGANIKRMDNGGLEIRNFFLVEDAVGSSEIPGLRDDEVVRSSYQQWLGAPAIRMAYVNSEESLEYFEINRQILIERVANSLDGSHPSAITDVSEKRNRFDAPIHYLLDYQVGGVPLPYLMLIKSAQDIVAVMTKCIADIGSKQQLAWG